MLSEFNYKFIDLIVIIIVALFQSDLVVYRNTRLMMSVLIK